MKTILLITTLGVLASTSTSFAGKRRPPPKKPVAVKTDIVLVKDAEVKFNFGDDYVIKNRETETPTVDAETFEAKPITESVAAKVVRERADLLEYCWLRVPAGKRVASSAVLKLAIEAGGSVVGAEVEGELPAGVGKCITAAASKWTFPAADSGCEIEHGISLNTKTDTLR